jgi:hypothetical protein
MVWNSRVKEWDLMSEGEQRAAYYGWKHAVLVYKLDPIQTDMYCKMKSFFGMWDSLPDELKKKYPKPSPENVAKTSFRRLWVNEWSRRLGKDFTTILFVREEMRKTKKAIYYYGTAIEDDIDEILIPLLDELEKDCPEQYKLIRHKTKGVFEDRETGAILRMIGLDINPDGIRGKSTNGIVITEYSYCKNIEASETAYKPMLTDSPDAWQINNSTPGETTTHKWHTKVVPSAKKEGRYSLRILDECPRFEQAQIDDAYDEFGGRDSTKSRREYRCEHVSEETKMVIPEWLKVKDICVRDEYELPEYAHCYTIIDPGQVHLFAFLYLLYDWACDTVVAQRAYTLRDPTTSEVAESIRESEHELWDKYTYYDQNRANYRKNPYMRYSDVDLRLIKDLSVTYDLEFHPTKKDDLKSAVKGLRDRVHSTKYVVLPGAEELVWHLNGGIWDASRKKFENVGGLLGHFDLLACAVYGNRNLDVDRNPLPPRIPKPNEFTARIREKQHPLTVKRDRYGNIIDKVKDNQCPVIPDYL